MMHVVDIVKVELDANKLNNVGRTWFNQWKKGRAKDTPHVSSVFFEESFFGSFFPQELKEAKLSEFLTPKQGSLSAHELWAEVHPTTPICSGYGSGHEKYNKHVCCWVIYD